MSDLAVERVGLDRLEACHAIRLEVFVRGQGVPAEIDFDGLDHECVQLLATVDGRAVGTARMRTVDGTAKAERVAVLSSERGGGIGRELMEALESEALRLGLVVMVLNAQAAVVEFYEKLGYSSVGERFQEAGIPHQRMQKCLAER